MMFSSHIDMTNKIKLAKHIRKITVNPVWALQEGTPYMRKWWVITFEQIVEFITNFGSIIKGAKPLNAGYLLVEEEMAVYELWNPCWNSS